jgi:putative tricarboxylic transport membrane protein
MRLVEALPAVFLIIVSALVLVGTSSLTYWADITPGPRFFPVWIAGISIALSVALLVQLRRGTDTGTTELPVRSAFERIA